MENKEIMKCSIMEEVREIRRRISTESGHDFNRLSSYSIQELAEFWDTHDLTDFEDELEEVSEPVFDNSVSVQLESKELEIIETLAKSRGISPENLIREWVVERIEIR